MSRKCLNVVLGSDGKSIQFKSAADVAAYVRGFQNLTVKDKAGYDKYWNEQGFTNPHSPQTMTPRTIGNMLAILMHRAHTLIGEGNAEMQPLLDAIDGYNGIAAEEIATAKTAALAKSVIASGLTPEQLAAFIAKNTPALPAGVAEVVEETGEVVAESAEPVAS